MGTCLPSCEEPAPYRDKLLEWRGPLPRQDDSSSPFILPSEEPTPNKTEAKAQSEQLQLQLEHDHA